MNDLLMEFHISKNARETYKFDMSLFETNGNVVFGNFHGARLLAASINKQKDLLNFPEKAAKASEIYAMGLMDEIFHFIFKSYRNQIQQNILDEALDFVEKNLTPEENKNVIEFFLNEFPPLSVYQNKTDLEEYINKTKADQTYSLLLEEIILLWVENQNPALTNYRELFRDKGIESNTNYKKFIKLLNTFFDQKPSFGPENQNIITMLRTPAIKVPNSIPGQLEYIRTHWSFLLGDLLYRLLGSIDFINEEQKTSFGGPGPSIVPGYNQIWDMDFEKFSPDKEWMPSLVLIAKNTYVWLDQIRKKYKRSITTIDQIPDEELDILRDRGFNGLWLIGVWERSKASAEIKQLCGNPEAIASAYSLAGYQIAPELGGESAYQILKERAWQRGIRLAADMVPNHMGIDSNWVYEHPDWFVQLNYSPFPAYSFNGANLSKYPHVDVKIEDHYYDRTDAAVVFQYKNHHSGETRFIYHGNDGTTMPWNDTAQLNYLIPEVREAVYQTILSVARRFSIIRFDAAMTLAKKHFQRLWFPEPGSGGAIPSRAEFGLSKDDFDQMMPSEFWRDVVDRLADDAPDTLLLAEAFWLMESYFVRTLGMHRVYNSAFMHMLRNEDNVNYKILIKNTMEFDPQILKRFVNFMNNPDEQTAVEQFGKGDKYFGICTLMSTLPGLPMFGHGQVEGFSEKYGMEYQRAYWDESEDQTIITRHNQQIAPLLHRRWMFSQVENFLMYDYFTTDNQVNDDVYVYSNNHQNQASLVVFNNKFSDTQGWINHSSTRIKWIEDGHETFSTLSLAKGLNIHKEFDFVIFRDVVTQLEFIRSIHEFQEKGLFLNLFAYQTHVFIEFHQIKDDEWQSYQRLCNYLNGSGVLNIEDAMKELLLQPIHNPMKEIFNRGYFDYLISQKRTSIKSFINPKVLAESRKKMDGFTQGIFKMTGEDQSKDLVILQTSKLLEFVLSIPVFENKFVSIKNLELRTLITSFQEEFEMDEEKWFTSFSYIFISSISDLIDSDDPQFLTQSWFDEFQFARIIRELGASYQYSDAKQNTFVQTIYTLMGIKGWYKKFSPDQFNDWLRSLLGHQYIQQFLNINRYQGVLWFNAERFELLTWWLFAVAIIEVGSDPKISTVSLMEKFISLNQVRQELLSKMKNSEYRVDKLLTEEK
jgi:glycosidase